jgi:hypothetical protein
MKEHLRSVGIIICAIALVSAPVAVGSWLGSRKASMDKADQEEIVDAIDWHDKRCLEFTRGMTAILSDQIWDLQVQVAALAVELGVNSPEATSLDPADRVIGDAGDEWRE